MKNAAAGFTRPQLTQAALHDGLDRCSFAHGGDRDLYDGETFPEKPKRMRWATYHRLEERYYDFKDTWELGVEQKIMGFLRRAM